MFTLHRLAEHTRQRRQKSALHSPFADDDDEEDGVELVPGLESSRVRTAHIAAFSVLLQQNLFIIQRHWATAPHYDLRIRRRDGLHSWAVPKGLMGMTRKESRIAVETTVHTLNYAMVEHSERRKGGRGTLLWDVGYYTIDELSADPESQDNSSDPDGAFEHEKFDLAMTKIGKMKKRSFVITLHGRKLKSASFMLTYPGNDKFKGTGEPKKDWFLRLAPSTGGPGPDWESDGEEGRLGRSVKTGRTMTEVCHPF